MALLILYHVVVSFQPWASDFFFIQNEETLEGVWILMAMINVWRIPILFLISGIGVYFAMERRTWKALLADRTLRILVPLVFGVFCICPITVAIGLHYFGDEVSYVPNPGHLWFLANIFAYLLLLLPLLVWLKRRPENAFFRLLVRLFRRRFGILLVAVPFMLEAQVISPGNFTLYVLTPHGFFMGLVCFLTGFVLVSLREVFWDAVQRTRHVALALALALCLLRLTWFELEGPAVLSALESAFWMLGILGLGATYLNKPSRQLAYASRAVYPVYIVHFPLQYLISYFIIPMSIPAIAKLLAIVALTFAGSLVAFELVKQLKWLRPLFGMKLNLER